MTSHKKKNTVQVNPQDLTTKMYNICLQNAVEWKYTVPEYENTQVQVPE